MESRVKERSPNTPSPDEVPLEEQRWGNVLEKVVSEQQSNDPWYVKLGVSLVWSAGIALAAGLVAVLILGVRALLSANVQFTFSQLSDHIFWTAALLMIVGMFSPSAGSLDPNKSKKDKQDRPRTPEERRAHAMERRLRRVYDPWRWRIWGGAALTFGLAVLSGLFV
jgi:hypothetical protein